MKGDKILMNRYKIIGVLYIGLWVMLSIGSVGSIVCEEPCVISWNIPILLFGLLTSSYLLGYLSNNNDKD